MPIERATPEDARAIAQLHVVTWRAAYKDIVPAEYLAALSVTAREAMWSESISRTVPDILLAKERGETAGFVAFGPCRDEGAPAYQSEIWAIYVAPSYWSTGIGRQLWLAARVHLVQQGYKSVSLWVLAQNMRATKFYLAAGFQLEPHSSKERLVAGHSLEEHRYIAVLRA